MSNKLYDNSSKLLEVFDIKIEELESKYKGNFSIISALAKILDISYYESIFAFGNAQMGYLKRFNPNQYIYPYYQLTEYMNLYSFVNEEKYKNYSCIICIEDKNRLYYIPYINGTLFDNSLIFYDSKLSSRVTGYILKDDNNEEEIVYDK